jgi:hypothetical protein
LVGFGHQRFGGLSRLLKILLLYNNNIISLKPAHLNQYASILYHDPC